MVWIKNRAEEQLEFSLFVQLLMRYENFCMVHMKLPLTDSRAGRYGLTASLAMFRDKKKKKKANHSISHISYKPVCYNNRFLPSEHKSQVRFNFFFLKKTEEKRKGTPPALIKTWLKRVCIVLPGAKYLHLRISPTLARPSDSYL